MYYRTPGNLNREAPLSIDDKLHVYPNPVGQDRLKAHLNGDRIIESTEVYDMTGKLRLSNTFDSRTALVLSALLTLTRYFDFKFDL